MKLLDSLPETKSTLPTVDYFIAKRAQEWLLLQHGLESSVWKVGDEWVLHCNFYPHGKFMMVRVMTSSQLWEGLELEALPPGSP